MGAGRSGTTILDTVLGNNQDIFSAGELNRFPKYQGLPLLVETKSKTAIFWNEFKSKLPDVFSKDRFNETQKLCHSFEYHSNVFKLWFPFYSNSLKQYQYYLKTFFSTLDPMVKETVLVDSSKYPLRGYYLAKFLDYEIVYIYIKRNPIDVVKSFAKKDIEQPSQGWVPANVYMLVVNLLSLFILNRISKKHKNITIKYDDLVAEPELVLNKIGQALSIDVSETIKMVQNGTPFKKGLLFDGNRMRLDEAVVLQINKDQTKPETLKERLTLILQMVWWP